MLLPNQLYSRRDAEVKVTTSRLGTAKLVSDIISILGENSFLNILAVGLHLAVLDFSVPFSRVVGVRPTRHQSVGRNSSRPLGCDSRLDA